jgi:hypothetical protein
MLKQQELQYVRCTQIDMLHPRARYQFDDLNNALYSLRKRGEIKTKWRIWETYRTPQRQRYISDYVCSQCPGPFFTPYQYGLAVQFVPMMEIEPGMWAPDFAYGFEEEEWFLFGQTARRWGLEVPFAYDPGCVVHPLWYEINALL